MYRHCVTAAHAAPSGFSFPPIPAIARKATALTLAAAALAPLAAQAQGVLPASAAIEATTDLRARGLGQSGGKAALLVDGTLPVTSSFILDARAATLRSSNRNGDAELGLEIAPQLRTASAGWTFTAGARAHLYLDAGAMDYVELEGGVSRTLGPAWLRLGAAYAPSQDAIGGDNLYLSADAELGLPGTGFTLYAGAGHTLGSRKDDTLAAMRAVRLRPDGDYTDYRLGIERSHLNLAYGMQFSDTTIDQSANRTSPYWDNDSGARVSGYMRVSF